MDRTTHTRDTAETRRTAVTPHATTRRRAPDAQCTTAADDAPHTAHTAARHYATDYATDFATDYATDSATNYATDYATNYATDYATPVGAAA